SGYPKTFRWESGGGNPATGPMLGQPCWADNPAWEQIIVDLDSYAGQDIQLRYRFGSDAGGTNEGWYVDDVLITGFGTVSVTEPTGFVILVDGTDLKLSWDADSNYGYRVYSDVDPMGNFTTFVGETTATELILDMSGGFDDKKFYIVKGWDGSAR
ncbi:immune inhibitor A, partial [bacterium]|nr:immune inhibitor A [bacterium]